MNWPLLSVSLSLSLSMTDYLLRFFPRLSDILALEDEEDLVESLVYEYGPQITLLLVLLAITFYRREISCNHQYHEEVAEEKEEDLALSSGVRAKNCPPESQDFWDSLRAEQMLDAASQYCSGSSLRPVLETVVDALSCQLQNDLPLDPEELLEKMGNFYSTDAIKFVFPVFQTSPSRYPVKDSRNSQYQTTKVGALQKHSLDAMQGLQLDTLVHVLSYLSPRDVLSVSCASQTLHTIINSDGRSSAVIWKRLFERDYGWIAQWDVGIDALQRSGRSSFGIVDREIYFRFGLCYVDWLLAGLNTSDRCFVGLQGHIYDMTSFLTVHPGSPETLLAHAGKDSTAFFEAIRHSSGARKIARTLCVVVNRAVCDRDGCGLGPTEFSKFSGDVVVVKAPEVSVESTVWQSAPAPILRSFRSEYRDALRRANNEWSQNSITGEVNVYYDPLDRAWKAWYTDVALESRFLASID